MKLNNAYLLIFNAAGFLIMQHYKRNDREIPVIFIISVFPAELPLP